MCRLLPGTYCSHAAAPSAKLTTIQHDKALIKAAVNMQRTCRAACTSACDCVAAASEAAGLVFTIVLLI